MGYALFVLLEQNISGAEGWDMCGKILAHNIEQLDNVAENLRVKTLTEMISVSQEYIEDLLSVEMRGASEEAWFSPQEGLATINALSDFVQTNPHQFHQTPQLLEDLADVKRYLELAEQHNVRFHLVPDV